jgi:hypothetical protein
MVSTDIVDTTRRVEESTVENCPVNVSWMMRRFRVWSRLSLLGRRKSNARGCPRREPGRPPSLVVDAAAGLTVSVPTGGT